VSRPGSGETTRTPGTASARAMSFASFVTCETFTPAASDSSKSVMTGPVWNATTSAATPNSFNVRWSVSRRCRASAWRDSAAPAVGAVSRSTDGSSNGSVHVGPCGEVSACARGAAPSADFRRAAISSIRRRLSAGDRAAPSAGSAGADGAAAAAALRSAARCAAARRHAPYLRLARRGSVTTSLSAVRITPRPNSTMRIVQPPHTANCETRKRPTAAPSRPAAPAAGSAPRDRLSM